MYFENSKSSLYFIIDGYLERDEDFFPDKETQLNTYDCWISYNPDLIDDDNTFLFPGIYLTTWMPEL
ncbi:MAG: hypothetical protein IIX39_06785, partial [Clostridia bacterium]|nr:hypothetical protein [Clostridia bacterium]